MAKSSSSRNRRPAGDEAGFSLVETMIATVLLATALVSTAHLLVVATQSNSAARRTTYSSTLAQDKMEQLRSLTWGFDNLGLPINDYTTNLTVTPPDATGLGLSPSPDDALASNITGYVDYVDREGNVLGGGATPPGDTVFVRRWSIEPLPTNPNNTLVLQVLVFGVGDRGDGTGVVLNRGRDEARLVSLKTRKAR